MQPIAPFWQRQRIFRETAVNKHQKQFSKALGICVCLMAVTQWSQASDGTAKDTRTPSKDQTEILQRFVAECILITPGKNGFPVDFQLGESEPAAHELPKAKSKLMTGFRISKYETTQELYQTVMAQNPSRWQGPRNSVETVSWNDVQRFCQRLTVLLQTNKLIGEHEIVRLPSAIEWEYCCRAGRNSRYSFGADVSETGNDTEILDKYAWHTGNAAGNDPAVGVLKPNAWGLFDMHGYLWEFVSDSSLPTSQQTEKGPSAHRFIRGGSWRDHHTLLSSSSYLMIPDHASSDAIGFRCVIAQSPPAKKFPNR